MINYIRKLKVTTSVDQYTRKFLHRQGLQLGILPSGISRCLPWYSERHISKVTPGFTVSLGLFGASVEISLKKLLGKVCCFRCAWPWTAALLKGVSFPYISRPPNSLNCPVSLFFIFLFVGISNKSWKLWHECTTFFNQKIINSSVKWCA